MGIKDTRKACKITDDIFGDLIDNFSEFKTERDIENFIKKEARKKGLKMAFPPIIASGWHSARPHHKVTKQKLQKGFCVIDFGVRVNGYCSDLSRTVYIGKISKKEKRLYELVLMCEKECIKRIKVGKKYKDLDMWARKFFKGYKKCFLHGLGHGFGKRIHCRPKIVPKSNDVVKSGDLITIEPGLYFKKKFGIRIEDDIFVGKNKVEVLTKANRMLIIF